MYQYTLLQVTPGNYSNKSNRSYHKNGHIDQLTKIENQDISPQSYIQVIFDKETKKKMNIGVKRASSTNGTDSME